MRRTIPPDGAQRRASTRTVARRTAPRRSSRPRRCSRHAARSIAPSRASRTTATRPRRERSRTSPSARRRSRARRTHRASRARHPRRRRKTSRLVRERDARRRPSACRATTSEALAFTARDALQRERVARADDRPRAAEETLDELHHVARVKRDSDGLQGHALRRRDVRSRPRRSRTRPPRASTRSPSRSRSSAPGAAISDREPRRHAPTCGDAYDQGLGADSRRQDRGVPRDARRPARDHQAGRHRAAPRRPKLGGLFHAAATTAASRSSSRRDSRSYFPLPRNSLMLPTIASLSRISLVTTRSSLPKCSRRSLMNCPEP